MALAWGICSSSGLLCAAELEITCIVRELDEVRIPALRAGHLAELEIRKGDLVSKGQTLGKLSAADYQRKLDVVNQKLKLSSLRARNEGPVKVATAAKEKAQMEVSLLKQLGKDALFLETFRAGNALAAAEAALLNANNQFAEAAVQREVDSAEVKLLEHDLAQLAFVSPFDGVIQEINKRPGEWTQQGEILAVVTRLDRLIVEGFVDSKTIIPAEITEKRAVVTVQLKAGVQIECPVLAIRKSAARIELDGKYAIWLEINNLPHASKTGQTVWQIAPGMQGKIVLQDQ